MILPLPDENLKPKHDNGLASDGDGIGLAAAEFIAAADSLLKIGHGFLRGVERLLSHGCRGRSGW